MIALTSPVKTPWHPVPAGIKLLLLCGFTVVLFQSRQIGFHLCAAGLVALAYLICGRRFSIAGLRALRPLWIFAALIMVWHSVTATPLEGAVITLRLVSAVGFANLVTMTTRLDDMISVLRWVLSPLRRFGIRTQPLELAIALVIRFTPVLAQKGALLSDSWRARSPKRAGWKILAPFAVLAIDDAEQVAEALKARGGLINNATDTP